MTAYSLAIHHIFAPADTFTLGDSPQLTGREIAVNLDIKQEDETF